MGLSLWLVVFSLAGITYSQPTDTVLKCRGYRVQQGDDVSSIANTFKTTINDLMSVNGEIAGKTIPPGTAIKLPPYDDSCKQPIIVTATGAPGPPEPVPNAALPPPAASATSDSDGGSNTGAIVGGIIGGIAAIALIAGGVWYYRMRKQAAPGLELQAEQKDGWFDPLDSAETRSPGMSPNPTDTERPPTLPSILIGDMLMNQTKSAVPSAPPLSTTASKASNLTTSNNSARLEKDPLLSLIASKTSSGSSAPISRRSSSNVSGGIDVRAWQIDWSDIAVVANIGEGSFGKVYKAVWRRTEIAVKVLTEVHDGETSLVSLSSPAMANLEKEATLMATLRHPNIVSFLGICLSPPAIATEYCERGSLTGVLRNGTISPRAAAELTWQRRLNMALDAATGMVFLHQHKPPIIHRDLKSPNIVVDINFRAKVCDFNLSKLIEESTTTSSVGGATNPRWLAPEVLHGVKADARADVYSFGVVLWELLTWTVPWTQNAGVANPWQIVRAIDAGQRPAIPAKKDLPGPGSGDWVGLDRYIKLMQACWAQRAEDRPNFDYIIDELGAAAVGVGLKVKVDVQYGGE